MAPPVAVLWADGDGQWTELVERLRGELPNLFTYGAYDPQRRIGPAIWLRCIVDRTLPEVWPNEAKPPIVYLPRVERQQLRAGGDCPPELQPLVELQYRGTVWHQRNGRDWTVEAFLTSVDACGLELARDQVTKVAMQRVLPQLMDVPIDALRGRRLSADDFDKLAVPDPQRDLLLWMHDPAAFRAGHSDAEWAAFCNLVRAGFGVNPDDDGVAEAARLLLEGEGQWAQLWQRFSEAPQRYRGISKLLREPMPGQGMLVDRARQPLENDEDESLLRAALVNVTAMPRAAACEQVLALEARHGVRRSWVWRHLGESPYAEALEPLSRLADAARKGAAGSSIEEIASGYASDGWRCDEAAVSALAFSSNPAQHELIAGVVRAMYLPWVEEVARQFQEAVARSGGTLPTATTPPPEPGTCLLFADGLRFDLAARLQASLEADGIVGRLTHRIGAVPSVTATAKPLATTIVAGIEGGDGTDFTPIFTDTKQSVIASRLRDRLIGQGVEVLDVDQVRMPASATAIGWIEVGRIDELGHKLGDGLAQQVGHEIDRLREVVLSLLGVGWRRVRVVTDHGWLLMPDGLPKIDLPQYLVASRWARCATVREGATPRVTTYPWYWNSNVLIASPPGAGAYSAGMTYAHGGISPQESVVPELTFERETEALVVKITAVEWKRLRCVVTVSSNDPAVRV
ncbi:MAG: BREX-1 system phosphatase PglZ type B, partial [Gemmatimonadales bacterium]